TTWWRANSACDDGASSPISIRHPAALSQHNSPTLSRVSPHTTTFCNAGEAAASTASRKDPTLTHVPVVSVLDGVSRQDHHRPLGVQSALDERLGHSIDNPSGLAIREASPSSSFITLRQEGPRRLRFDGPPKQLSEAWFILAKRHNAAHKHRAAGTLFARDLRLCKSNVRKRYFLNSHVRSGVLHFFHWSNSPEELPRSAAYASLKASLGDLRIIIP